MAQPVVPLQVMLQAVAEEHARPFGQGPGVPTVHPPELLQVPAGVKVAFPEVSVVQDVAGVQSLFVQQLAFGMQAVPHVLKPVAHG